MKKSRLVIVIAAILVLFTACGGKSISLEDYATVSFSGLNGRGTASAKVDYNGLEGIITESMKKKADSLEGLGSFLTLMDSIKYEVAPKEGLSNGDKVTITAKVNQELGKKNGLNLKPFEKTIEVVGLEEGKILDLFADVEIVTEGVSPNLKVSVKNRSEDTFLKQSVSYNQDYSNGLANGDTITVTANFSQTTADEKGYLIDVTEKTYTIEGADEYLTDSSLLTPDSYSKMKNEAQDLLDAALAKSTGNVFYEATGIYDYKSSYKPIELELESNTLIESHYVALKPGEQLDYGESNNRLYFFYELKAKEVVSGDPVTAYLAISFSDLIQSGDGEQIIDLTSKYLRHYDTSRDNLYKETIETKKATYNITQVPVK